MKLWTFLEVDVISCLPVRPLTPQERLWSLMCESISPFTPDGWNVYAFRNVLQRTQENGKVSEMLICVEFKLVMYCWCMFLC